MSKKPISVKVRNYYEVIDKDLLPKSYNPNFELHHIKLPFRMMIVAPSGTGKSNYLFHLLYIFGQGKGTFGSITIVTQNSDESLYNQLRRSCKGIKILDGISKVPDLTEENYEKDANHLIVFDDLVNETAKSQKAVIEYYMRARKLNVSAIYLTQRYYETPKMIRTNSNYTIILSLQDDRDLEQVLRKFKGKLDKQTLINMYEYATAEKFVPLFIENDNPVETRFRKDLDEVLDPSKFTAL